MHTRTDIARLAGLLGTILATNCKQAASPDPGTQAPGVPAAVGSSITVDQKNGSFATGEPYEAGTHIGKGFTPTNPHNGDAIVVTFFWRGSTNVIHTVEDHLSNGTPVGNTYTLVEYVTSNGMSMATYVATNVQNFPDPNPDESTVLAVHALTSTPVTGDGVLLSAYRGVDPGSALGPHRSAAGSGSSPTTVGPGAITLSRGSLAYGVTVSNLAAGVEAPTGLTNLTTMSGAAGAADEGFLVRPNGGTVDLRWTWSFNAPGTGLASVLSLRPAAVQLTFAVQPTNTPPSTSIKPPVQVAALNADGNTATTFSGPVTIAVGQSGAVLSGTKTVNAVNGVATFNDLSIEQARVGYTLVATSPGLTGAVSAVFNVGGP